jgi:hypothetical protein
MYKRDENSQDNAVGIATGYGLDSQGTRIPVGKYFSSLHVIQTGFGTHPASYPVCPRDSLPGGKADHSPLTSAKVKNTYI